MSSSALSPERNVQRDPLLSVHLADRGLVDLAGYLFPGSIRDQVIRAVAVTERLWTHGLLVSGHHLLVIGAGAAGIASAVRAAQLGVSVWLIEKELDALPVWSASAVRVISPSLYDWPSLNWREKTYIGVAPPFHEGTPNDVATTWLSWLRQYIDKNPSRLNFLPQVTCRINNTNGPAWSFDFSSESKRPIPQSLKDATFDVVYRCHGTGAAKEQGVTWANGTAEHFPIFGFWGSDPFPPYRRHAHEYRHPLLGKSGELSSRILIVGAGDGGIQDFLRFVTGGRSTREIIDHISNALSKRANAYRAIYRVLDSETNAQKHLVYWTQESRQSLLDSVNDLVINEIRNLFRNDPDLMKELMASLVIDDDILVVHRGRSLGQCYALNRFLALLFDYYLRNHGGRLGAPFLFGMTAKSVHCNADHETKSDRPSEHRDGGHVVTLEDSVGAEVKILCRTVVSRIGPALPRNADRVQQLLPLWLPNWGPEKGEAIRLQDDQAVELTDDRSCRRALWRHIRGMAVIKDSSGRVVYLNRRFAECFGYPAEVILGKRADFYAKDISKCIERQDQTVRSKLISLFTYSHLGREPHYCVRFAHPLENGGIGTASLGFTFYGEDHSVNDLTEPSARQLERFFEWLPCSVAITGRSHELIYANQAFRRLFTPDHAACVPTIDLYGWTWDQLCQKFNTPADNTSFANEKRAQSWAGNHPSTNWYSNHPFNRQRRLVFGFPIFDRDGEMIGLGSVGVVARFVERARTSPDAEFAVRYKLVAEANR